MPSCPRNYPFYNWVPKPIGIIILLFFFLPILSVGGVYSVNSTEMMSGLGIISEHIQFANFVTSIGMAAFAPFLYELVCIRREKLMCIAGFALMYVFSYMLLAWRQRVILLPAWNRKTRRDGINWISKNVSASR